jgi:hypothetical protein
MTPRLHVGRPKAKIEQNFKRPIREADPDVVKGY